MQNLFVFPFLIVTFTALTAIAAEASPTTITCTSFNHSFPHSVTKLNTVTKELSIKIDRHPDLRFNGNEVHTRLEYPRHGFPDNYAVQVWESTRPGLEYLALRIWPGSDVHSISYSDETTVIGVNVTCK